jgi:hypothetical protein
MLIVMSIAVAIAGCAGRRSAVTTPAPIKYSLPKTTLVVELQVERTNESPGKYCDFLDLFFPELEAAAACQSGDNPMPGEQLVAAKRRTTVQGYGMILKGIPDPSRTHDVTFDASWNVERTDSLALTEGGTLTGAEMQHTDRTGEIVLGILANVAKIAGRFVFGGGDEPLAFSSAPPWIRILVLKENFSFLSPSRQQAYAALWETREGKARLALATRSYETLGSDLGILNNVLGGVGALGAQTLVTELRKQVSDRLTDDFLGSKTKDAWNPIYEFTPDMPMSPATSQTYTLFSFAGCGVSAESLQPVKNRLGALHCADLNGVKAVDVTFRVKTASGAVASRVTTPDAPPALSDVLHVIRPEPVLVNLQGSCRADVTILVPAGSAQKPTVGAESSQPCNIVDQQSLLAQWGVQAAIPKAGKDWAYTVALYEATGAVKTIKLASKAALDKTTIDAAFGIANTLLDAKDTADAEAKKAADAAAAAADELAVLTRSRQILDEKAKIKKLCVELGLTTCEF